jgi:hypothetical protein
VPWRGAGASPSAWIPPWSVPDFIDTGLGRQFVSFLYPSSYSRGVKYFGCGVSSPAVVVTFDPQECVLLDLGEVVPWAGVDEFLFVGGEE